MQSTIYEAGTIIIHLLWVKLHQVMKPNVITNKKTESGFKSRSSECPNLSAQ